MRDLNDIIENNNRATQEAIPRECAAGHHVVAKYTGVNFLGYTKHDSLEAAQAEAALHCKSPGFRAVIHAPTKEIVGAPV